MSARHETSGAAGFALWRGVRVPESELESRVAELGRGVLPRAFGVRALLSACERLSRDMLDGELRAVLVESLCFEERFSRVEASATVDEAAAFLARESLERKVVRELGGLSAQRLERVDFRQDIFESWAPIGMLAHIAPTNAANVPFLSVIEGLLAGNVNVLKLGGSDTLYPLLCLEALVARELALAEFVYAARISSRNQGLLRALLACADGVAVWGGEEAVAAVRGLAPAHARVIEWGHKISFAYVAQESMGAGLEDLARECCLMEQQACSSPQVVYVETPSSDELAAFGERLAAELERVSLRVPRAMPSLHERAEITKVVEVARLEACLEGAPLSRVIEGDGWRVMIDAREGLRASPLYRSVWVKPLPRARIVPVLWPLRHYLQTVGVICGRSSLAELSAEFFRAGALRVTPAGAMLAGYVGEPHDGVYALQRYSRRVSVAAPGAGGLAALDSGAAGAAGVLHPDGAKPQGYPDAPRSFAPKWSKTPPVLDKTQFGLQTVDEGCAELFFKSGGSSGEPKLSVFTYDDYHAQMRAAAHGVYAAGLDPRTDRCANLFFSGGLYGGFVSFFTILEHLKAVQLPMTAYTDLEFVGRMIVDKQVNTLLGMPSYLAQLFRANDERFKQYRGIRKIFYGGEHLSEAQRAYYRDEYGVELLRSAAYGSNDIGPMGYQCSECTGSTHHLHEDLHELEILDLHEDKPAEPGEAGRLVFTSLRRRGQDLARYDIGDLGRWVPGPCACGRAASPRFELLGRQGDIFRCGGSFLNFQRFARTVSETAGATEFQLEVSGSVSGDQLLLRYAAPAELPGLRRACLDEDKDLREIVSDGCLQFDVRAVAPDELDRVATSGKLRRIVDRRGGA